MPITYTQPLDGLLSTTLANYRKSMVNNIVLQIPVFFWLMDKQRKLVLDGGAQINIPLLYGENSTFKSYSKYGQLDVTPQEGMTLALYQWKQYAGSVAIARLEERQNSGEWRIVNLLDAKVKQLEITAQDILETDALKATPGANDLDSIDAAVDTTTTYGGISGSTFAFWQATKTASGSFAAQGISDMRVLFNTISKGNDTPDLGLTDQNTFQYYENALQPQIRFTNTKVADAGFQALMFKSMTLMWSQRNIAGYLYMLNSKYLNWAVDKETDFITTPFVRPENQDAKVAQLLVMGNIVTSNRARQGKLTGITA